MKISSRGQYAIKAMLMLGLNENANPVSINAIAEVNKISISYLEQLFSQLRGKKLIIGVRGPGGGYYLSKSSKHISIADILAAIDEPTSSAVHPVSNKAPSLKLWNSFSDQLYDFLDNITLDSLMDRPDIKRTAINRDKTTQYISSMFKPTGTST